MRKVLALVALLITKASYASCRYGQWALLRKRIIDYSSPLSIKS